MNLLQTYADDLVERDEIFFARNKSQISYPEEGNQVCFQIEQDSFWFNHRNNCIIEAVNRYAPDEIFFDIGGGNGFVAHGLEKAGIQTVLVEPGIQGCLNAKARGLPHIVCSTLENASFKVSSIKSIGLFDVVEHIEDDNNFLTSIYNYLSNKGHVFITVPAYKALWSNEDDDAGHYKRYTAKSLSDVLEQSGFEIVYASYIFSILPIPVFFFRALPSKLGMNKNSNAVDKQVNEHKSKKGIIDSVLNRIWAFEVGRIKKGKIIPIGGSCFVIARKKP